MTEMNVCKSNIVIVMKYKLYDPHDKKSMFDDD